MSKVRVMFGDDSASGFCVLCHRQTRRYIEVRETWNRADDDLNWCCAPCEKRLSKERDARRGGDPCLARLFYDARHRAQGRRA